MTRSRAASAITILTLFLTAGLCGSGEKPKEPGDDPGPAEDEGKSGSDPDPDPEPAPKPV